MPVMSLGTGAADFIGNYFLEDVFYTLVHSPDIAPGSATATATYSETIGTGEDEYTINNIVTFSGTGLNTADGTITSISYTYQETGDDAFQLCVLSGLNIDSGDMLSAITAAGSGNREPLKALFAGLNWTVEIDGTDTQTFAVGGTGGNDVVTLGAENDAYLLDGGNDTVKLGAGYDEIYYGNTLRYAAAGHTTIDGGKGFDMLIAEGGPESDPYLTEGLTINLTKVIDFGAFTVKLKSVEDLTGTYFSDTLIGTDGEGWIVGNGGGDRLIGLGGRDDLWGGVSVDDFFTYKKVSDSKANGEHDIIHAFEHGLDIIDLKAIDADTKNGAFKFVGDNALKNVGDLHVIFSNKPGTQNDRYYIEANLDKDKAAEFRIELVEGDTKLTKADFIL